MLPNLIKHAVIPIIPRSSTPAMREEGPVIRSRPTVHHDPVQPMLLLGLGRGRQKRVVLLPHGRQEPLPARVHDAHVRQGPAPVVPQQGEGDVVPEGVVGTRGEDVVAQGAAAAVGGEGGVVEKGFEGDSAAL
jgi:hypothetical protein